MLNRMMVLYIYNYYVESITIVYDLRTPYSFLMLESHFLGDRDLKERRETTWGRRKSTRGGGDGGRKEERADSVREGRGWGICREGRAEGVRGCDDGRRESNYVCEYNRTCMPFWNCLLALSVVCRADKGFKHVKPSEYTPRLLHFHLEKASRRERGKAHP